MVEWKTVFVTVGFIVLCFFAIPIKINNVELVEEHALFLTFMKKYNRTYDPSSEEYKTRFKIFQGSLEQIKELNSLLNDSSPTVYYGITEFADINHQEFDDKYLTYEHNRRSHERKRVLLRHSHERRNRLKRSVGDGLPRSVDWRDKGCVTKVRNQKTCGACWAFSAVSTVESMVAIKTGVLKSFSTQEIIDCARYGNMGCDGGDTCNLLQWLVDFNIGIQEEKEYPLVLTTGTCKLKESNMKGVHVASNFSCDYLVGDENTMLALLAYHGPVAVAVNALPWQFYLGGVIQFHCKGGIEDLNHAVQLVGYNLDATPPYYIARNSWGTSFGEKGYLRLAVGSNVCGIASEVAALDVII